MTPLSFRFASEANRELALSGAKGNLLSFSAKPQPAVSASKHRPKERLNMDEDLAQQILNELFEHLEDVETQSAAILHFLKARKIATDKELAPYLEEASKAASVRWVAERARINHLLATAKRSEKAETKQPEQGPKQSDETKSESAEQTENKALGKTGAKPEDDARNEKDKKDRPDDPQAAGPSQPKQDVAANPEGVNTADGKREKRQRDTDDQNTAPKENPTKPESAKERSTTAV